MRSAPTGTLGPAPRRTGMWVALGVVGLVVAGIVTVAVVASGKGGNGAGSAAPGSAAPGSAGAAVTTTGSGTAVVAPPVVSDAAVAPPPVVLDAAVAVAPPAPPDAAQAAQKDATVEKASHAGTTKRGHLTVQAFPVMTVYIDKKKLHDTPVEIDLPVGKHVVRLVNTEDGKDETVPITIGDKPVLIDRTK